MRLERRSSIDGTPVPESLSICISNGLAEITQLTRDENGRIVSFVAIDEFLETPEGAES